MNSRLASIVLALALTSCNSQQEKNLSIESKRANVSSERSEPSSQLKLADSLLPKTYFLDSMPSPVFRIATEAPTSHYLFTNPDGEIKKSKILPPESKDVAVLRGIKGNPLTDKEGNSFPMGDKGKSNFTNFTTESGLPIDGIGPSIIDRFGNIWSCTYGGGLFRYDGKSFTNFSISQGLLSSSILSILEDKNGNIWLGTDGEGINRYDGRSFINFANELELPFEYVWDIEEDRNGDLWFSTNDGGVIKYDVKRDNMPCNQRNCGHNLLNKQELEIHKKELSKSFTSFTTAQGLANNSVRCINEDKNGNLWFGTQGGGVSRYDYKRSKQPCNNNLCKHNLDDLEELKEHQKIIAKSFTNISTMNIMPGAEDYVYSIFDDKNGDVWFGISGVMVKYDGKFDNHPCHNTSCKHDLSIPNELDNHNKELLKSLRIFSSKEGTSYFTILDITEDKNGFLWMATDGGGVSRFDGEKFTTYSETQGLAKNNVWSITPDKIGNLWFGTMGGGLSRYNGSSCVNITTNHGLNRNLVWSIIEDKEGNLWFGTERGGVNRYNGLSFSYYGVAQGLANYTVISIAEDMSGNLWFGTQYSGVSRFNGKSFTSFDVKKGLAGNYVSCIIEDKMGNIWLGTNGGISKYDSKSLPEGQAGITNYSVAQGLTDNNITCIFEERFLPKNEIGIWFGTTNGLSRFDGKSFTNFGSAQGLAKNYVFDISGDKSGNIWFGTESGLSLLLAEDVKKISSGLGTSRFNNNNNPLFKSFTTDDGLPDNVITQIIQMPDGRMALGSNSGITFFELSEDFNKLESIENFSVNTGYPIKDVNVSQNSMIVDSKGIIWAATGSEKTALVRFDYNAINKDTIPPELIIQSVKVNDENISWYNLEPNKEKRNTYDSTSNILQEFLAYGRTLSKSENEEIYKRFGSIQFDSISKFYPLPQNLILPHKNNKVSFEFAAIETSRPFLLKYQYMLEGYDKDWSPATSYSNASFGNINEGSYVFKVRAKGANGIWTKPVTYKFEVLPPWYRTWWAYLAYALIVILILGAFIKWRERNLRLEKERLEYTVELRTAEVVAEKKEVEKQKKLSDDLLLNILPEEVAEELKEKGSAEAKLFEEATVLFTDFKGFTSLSEKLSPKELVNDLNVCFSEFDKIVSELNVEKIKTIGDSYMAAGGLPTTNNSHSTDVIKAAIRMRDFVEEGKAKKIAAGLPYFEIRIGIHTGPLVAGIVGVKKFQYDIWGDTVNTASRMESNGEVGQINISGATYQLVKDKFKFTYRGKIQAKGKGELDMYFVEELN